MEFIEFKSFLDDSSILEKFDNKAVSDKLYNAVTRILESTFAGITPKLEIKNRDGSINFACPICLDSSHNFNEKRGHIYHDGLNFKCWNCGAWRTLPDFLAEFGMGDVLTSAEIKYLKDNALERRKFTLSSGNFAYHSTDFLGIEEFAIPRSQIMSKAGLIDVENDNKILNYLRGRLQIPYDKDLRHFAYNRKDDMLCYFNTFADKEKVIGMQFRNQSFKKGRGSRFLSLKYSDIWHQIFGVEKIKDELKDKIDKFALIYNVMRVNYNQPVFIFEGTMDANHFSNSLATWSASTKIYLDNGYYFYDNTTIDKAGMDASIAMLKKGHYVFLWKKFVDKFPQYRYCKDLNDVFKRQPIKQKELMQYFSKNTLDMLYL